MGNFLLKQNTMKIISSIIADLVTFLRLHNIMKPIMLNVTDADIRGHYQVTGISCVPMAIECILKLLKLMPITDFSLQNDPTKSGNSNWIHSGFVYPTANPVVSFSREFLLSDIGLPDRGPHFTKKYYKPLFRTIDSELINGRFVFISLQSAPTATQWHMEVVFQKVSNNAYKTITFYHGNPNPIIYNAQDLRQRVADMQGTDIITYKYL